MDAHPVCHIHPSQEATVRCQRCGQPICTQCMIPAAVGFQCPNCVSQGRKETRQAIGPYGGTRSSKPTLTSRVLIGLNVAVWAAIMATGQSASALFRWLALMPLGICTLTRDETMYLPGATEAMCQAEPGTTWFDGAATGAYWQVITNAFTHLDVMHIGFNMLALWFLGPQLEAVLGRVRYLALYLLSALTASAVVMWFSNPATATLGASGAVFGLMGAILVIAHKHKGDVRTILMWLGANAVITIVGRSFISWEGHLGGFLGGVLIAAILVYSPREQRTRLQWLGIGALTVVTLAAIVARIVLLT